MNRFDTLEICCADWGYCNRLANWGGDRVAEAGQTPDGHHKLRATEENIIPGVQDRELLGPLGYGGYGFVRPWDEDLEGEELALQDHWKKSKPPRLDYYIALLNGNPDPDCAVYLYTHRMIVTGMDEDNGPLPRLAILKHLQAVGIDSHFSKWEPCQVFHGIDKGFPMFSAGLKAHTDYGPRWFSESPKFDGDLPPGYQWDRHHSNMGILHFDEEFA